jgi:hypothetical protein
MAVARALEHGNSYSNQPNTNGQAVKDVAQQFYFFVFYISF